MNPVFACNIVRCFYLMIYSVIDRMKEDEWFVVRWEELENLRKKDVLSKYRKGSKISNTFSGVSGSFYKNVIMNFPLIIPKTHGSKTFSLQRSTVYGP